MIAVDSTLCEGVMGSYRVEHKTTDSPWLPTSQLSFNKNRWDGKPRQHLDDQSAGKLVEYSKYPAIKVCKQTKPKEVFRLFTEVLNRK